MKLLQKRNSDIRIYNYIRRKLQLIWDGRFTLLYSQIGGIKKWRIWDFQCYGIG